MLWHSGFPLLSLKQKHCCEVPYLSKTCQGESLYEMGKKGQKVELVVLLQSAWFLKVSKRAHRQMSLAG